MDRAFWNGRRVFLTGHTGFKGGWMSLWLQRMGAQVFGYALQPPTQPSLFETANVQSAVESQIADVRDLDRLRAAVRAASPQVVFHLAAQPIVREGFKDPVGTFSTNVMGTAHLLEACRDLPALEAVVIVTTDKCYQNNEWPWGYRENDPMGGHDPYSASKGCAELVTHAYAKTFFDRTRIASVRAGNVIGGGDWALDRLIPDAIKAFGAGEALQIRNPSATRPWQHVLEPLHGYLQLAERLCGEDGTSFEGGWNFGPPASANVTVGEVVERMVKLWGEDASWAQDPKDQPKEAQSLHLDTSKARVQLRWVPALTLAQSLTWTVRWYKEQASGTSAAELCARDIQEYEGLRG